MRETLTLSGKLELIKYFIKHPLQKIEYKFSKPIILKNKYGEFKCGTGVPEVWTCSSLHDPGVHKELEKIKGGVFIDIGAHIGSMTIQVARQMDKKGKVIALEPFPYYFNMLKKNIEHNKLSNVKAHALACSDKEEEINLSWDLGDHKPSMKVKTINIDKLVKLDKLLRVDVIKIDVEGAELKVLKGCKKTIERFKPKIIFEANSSKEYEILTSEFKKMKYEIFKIDKNNYYAIFVEN